MDVTNATAGIFSPCQSAEDGRLSAPIFSKEVQQDTVTNPCPLELAEGELGLEKGRTLVAN